MEETFLTNMTGVNSIVKVIITLLNLTGLVLIIIVLPELNRIIFIMISTYTLV
jgi:hypothetical protein